MSDNSAYSLVSSKLTVEDKTYTTYGIAGSQVVFSDVSVDKQKVMGMIQKINDAQLEECHLKYFIEDELVRGDFQP